MVDSMLIVNRMASVKAAWAHRDHRLDPTACADDKACKSSTSNPKSNN
jgi:hypothetical protein